MHYRKEAIEYNTGAYEKMDKFTLRMTKRRGLLLALIMLLLIAGCGSGGITDNAGNAGTGNSSGSSEPNGQQAVCGTSESGEPVDTGDLPVATIEMEDGCTIRLVLYPDIAPITVNNFIALSNSGFYNGVIFHRVIDQFMIQGGDPLGNGTGGPGYAIKGEFKDNGVPNDLKHERGVISMARQGGERYDTAGSQFFIMVKDTPQLDGGYAAFGKVIEGMNVVDRIAKVKTGRNDRPVEPPVIAKISVDTKGITYPAPEKITE